MEPSAAVVMVAVVVVGLEVTTDAAEVVGMAAAVLAVSAGDVVE